MIPTKQAEEARSWAGVAADGNRSATNTKRSRDNVPSIRRLQGIYEKEGRRRYASKCCFKCSVAVFI